MTDQLPGRMGPKKLRLHKGPWLGWFFRFPLTPRVSDSKFLPVDNVEYLCPDPVRWWRVDKTATALDEKPNVKAWRGAGPTHLTTRSHQVLFCSLVPCLKAVTSLLKQRPAMSPLTLGSTWEFFRSLLIVLTCLQYFIPATHWGSLTLKLWGGWLCGQNNIWWMCSLNPHLRKTHLEKRVWI